MNQSKSIKSAPLKKQIQIQKNNNKKAAKSKASTMLGTAEY
jgi:hypothetical protein